MQVLPQHNWLLSDTLDLALSDPSCELAFFRNDIMFFSPALEGVSRVPMDNPDLSRRQPLYATSSFSYSPSSISFTSNYKRCYATGQGEVWEKFKVEKILSFNVDGGKTSGISPLPFTLDSCRYLHPALSVNDSMMVFSSDRLPTSGGLDLFVSKLDSSGWSQAKNLGPSINTGGHERYSFLDGKNNLWFASTGHMGYGAYDLYVCPFNGEGWEAPQNLGPSINTPQNEFGFSIHAGAQAALFTREAPTGGGIAIRLRNKEKAEYSIILVLINQANPPNDPVQEELSEEDLTKVESEESLQETTPERDSEPDRLLFRVQILSSSREGSTPDVRIKGEEYSTYEYHYKGFYRITVGGFETVEAANTFRLLCKQSGFEQAFVAAFRGRKRETDPSVFIK